MLSLLSLYGVMRAIAIGCTGGGCDLFIPISLALPLLILAVGAIAGFTAIASARGSAWFAWLIVSTVLGVAGPIVALLIFRDSPDRFVATAAFLEVQLAVVVLAYTFTRAGPVSTR